MNQCREAEMQTDLARFESKRVEEEEKKRRKELEKRFGALPGLKRLIADVGDEHLALSMLERVQQYLDGRGLPPSELPHRFEEVCYTLRASQPEDRRVLRLVINTLGGRRR